MASIKTVISLQDQMSAPLKHMSNAMNMMLSSWNSLDAATRKGIDIGDVDGIRSELDQLNKSLDQLGDKQKKVNDKLKQGADAVSVLTRKIAGLVAGIGFAKMAKDAIEFASDLTEVQNVVDVSFGANSAKVDEWATTTLNAFGLNELSAKQFAGTMGAMLKSSGLTGDSVADMSMKITELAGDMASFYNLEGEEAFAKIRSGISGETEPLKQLGINMSVANLEAFALSQGITTAYNSMTQAEQVTLRYNYLLQATADAQGDFARTADSFANQQKLLTENWKAFTGELASNVIPILTRFFQILNNGIQFLGDNIDWIMPLLIGLIGVIGTYSAIHMALGAAQAFAAAKQWLLNNAVLACPVFWIIAALIALIAIIVAVANHISNTAHRATTAFGVITGGINVVIQFFVNLWEAIKTICSNIPIAFQNAWIGAQAGLAGFISSVLSGILKIAEALNKLPFVEFDYGGLSAAASSWSAKQADLKASKQEYNKIDAFDSNWSQVAFAQGAMWGDQKWNSWFGKDSSTGGIDVISDGFDNSGLANDIANNTGSAAKSLETTSEDLKYLRDIAEQEAINRFTTAEVKVDLGGITNNVSSGTDLDGIIDYLVTGVSEALEVVAEGVHA